MKLDFKEAISEGHQKKRQENAETRAKQTARVDA
jgi:hypothetical protein